MMYRVPGISISESLHGNQIIETVLREFPEVATVFSRTGSPEVATDPMAIDQSDVYVTLKPMDQWPTKRSKDDLIDAMKKRLEEGSTRRCLQFFPTNSDAHAGADGRRLPQRHCDQALRGRSGHAAEKADQIAEAVSKVSGAADVNAERVAGLPYLRIRSDREALARHGLDESDALDTVEAIGGKPVGEIVEGNRRFTLQVRFPQEQRATADAISNLRVGDNEGHFIPLAQLADIGRKKARPDQP